MFHCVATWNFGYKGFRCHNIILVSRPKGAELLNRFGVAIQFFFHDIDGIGTGRPRCCNTALVSRPS